MSRQDYTIENDGPSTSYNYINNHENIDLIMSNKINNDYIKSNVFKDKELTKQMRREKDKIRARERRMKESDEKKQNRREKCRLAQAKRRQEETEEQRERRLAIDRERAKKRRMRESDEQKQLRLEMNRIRTAIRRQGTVDLEDAIKAYKEDPEVKNFLDIPGNRIKQIGDLTDELKITIAVVNDNEPEVFYKITTFKKETKEQRDARLEKGRMYAAKRRMEETLEQRQRRLERERNSTRRRRAKNSVDKSRSSSIFDDISININSNDSSVNNNQEQDERIQNSKEDESVTEIHQKNPQPSTSESINRNNDQINNIQNTDIDFNHSSISVDPLAGFNGCNILGSTSSNPLGVQPFNNDISNLFDFSQIYQVFQPTASLNDTSWATSNGENVLKDRNDMYFLQNFGLDTSTSPHASTTNIFGTLNQQQTGVQNPSNLFRDEDNPSAIGMLLKNLSNNPQAIDSNSFNSSFNPNPFLSAGLIQCASPTGTNNANVFGNLDGRIDSILMGTGVQTTSSSFTTQQNLLTNSPVNMTIQNDASDRNNVELSPFFVQIDGNSEDDHQNNKKDDEKLQEETEKNTVRKLMNNFILIVKNSFDSFILLLESISENLKKEGCTMDLLGRFNTCSDMTLFPNSGLHLIVSFNLVEKESNQLRNLYYSSIYKQLKLKDKFNDNQLYGNDDIDKCCWSELFDTLRILHLELANVLFEKRKTDTVDTACFNSVERLELSIKRTHFKRLKINQNTERRVTFMDYALVELLDFLDHIAQVTWMVFPYLSRERNEIKNNNEYRNIIIDY